MMLDEEKWHKDWSETSVADSHCSTEWKVTATYYRGLTDGILSQGSVQHSQEFCLRSFKSASINVTSYSDIVLCKIVVSLHSNENTL